MGNLLKPAADRDHQQTIVYIMRHAPTEWNAAGRIQGQKDSPLTPIGQTLASHWGSQLADLGVQRIVSSDTGRALATARLINETLQLPMDPDARLREQDWGQWTGRTMAEIRTTHKERFTREEQRGWSFCPPGGEERLDVLTRAREALMDASQKWPQTRLLVVSHEGVLKCLVYHLAIIHNCGRNFAKMAPYHLHRLALTGDNLVLDRMNALKLKPSTG